MKPLRIALTKGRLEKDTVGLFERLGYDCTEVKNKGRRLILPILDADGNTAFEVVLAKAADVITYVEHGVCDLGVAGKDTIMEHGSSFYEVLDLGFGKCRMCVCGPAQAKELLAHQEQIRVATKYPNIAKDYFYNRKNQTVEIIKLNGSIELAPIVGLSEVIVDIVETGSTLRENGLTVLEEVCPLSARVVVNQVSMKMENQRITRLLQDLNRVVQAREAENAKRGEQ